jgi:hypothetical protein
MPQGVNVKEWRSHNEMEAGIGLGERSPRKNKELDGGIRFKEGNVGRKKVSETGSEDTKELRLMERSPALHGG